MALSDNFNRADGALGSNWVTPVTNNVNAPGAMKIASNQAGALTDDKHSFARWSANTFTDDQFSQVKVSTIGAWVGCGVRMETNVDRFYYGFVFAATDYRLYRFWDGTHTQLVADSTVTWSAGDTLRIEILGSVHPITLKMYRNGVQVLTWTSPDATWVKTGGSPGIGIYSPAGLNLRLDDFAAGNLSKATDNFNRADGTLGTNWSPTLANTGNLTVASNKVGVSGSSLFCYAFWNNGTFNDNQYSQIKLSTVGTFSGVILRADGILNRFYLGIVDTGYPGCKIYAAWDGALTELNNFTSTWVAGDVLKFDVVGTGNPTVLTIYKNGTAVLVHTVTATYFRSGGAPGMFIDSISGSPTLDDWEGGYQQTDPVVVVPSNLGLTTQSLGLIGAYQKHFA